MNTRGGDELRLDGRHSPSGENSRFNGEGLSFAEYVLQTTAMLRRVHARLGTAEMEKVVAGNAPFELRPAADTHRESSKPYRRGVLLTHGLTDSPYFMRYLAEFFRENGFLVMAVLLPGHGTQTGDLLDITWKEWDRAVAYGTDRLAEEVDEVYLAGFSAGAILSVYQSLRDKRVYGLFLFSPAFRISPRAAWAKLHRLYSWLWHEAAWVSIMPDRDIYKYESLCKNAAAQMYALTKKLNALLQKRETNIPVFAAASQDDTTANISATLEFMAHAHHPSSRLVLYTSDIGKLPSGHGKSAATDNETCHDRFPDKTTSHSTKQPKYGCQVAGYHPNLPPEGNPHPIPPLEGEGSIALSPFGGKMDRGPGTNESLRGFYVKGIPAEKMELINSVVMEQRILSSAHTAIVLPPDDVHYGVNGDYSNSLHYYPGDMEKYHACNNRHGEAVLGEITEANLKADILKRLMYNPHFEKLKVSLKRFIDHLT